MIAHCLFEQSGTFKNEFIKFGFDAFDYDLQNEFGNTDYVCDLFSEICAAYSGGASIFDRMKKDDVVLAFFPCTRFECQVQMFFKGNANQQKHHTDVQKLECAMKMHKELHELYVLICKLFVVALRMGLRMVVENPANPPHYLTAYFPIKPKIIDKDRSANGDYFKKPTQYWFLNFDPSANMLLEPLDQIKRCNIERGDSIGGKDRQTSRSMIHPQYARRFIYNNILTKEQAKQASERGNGYEV